jgi:hypothetical protein
MVSKATLACKGPRDQKEALVKKETLARLDLKALKDFRGSMV